jgi:hypothetical protein
MQRNQIWALMLGTLIVGFGAAVSVQAAARERACGAIRAACEQAGFVLGGARAGDGLFMHCIAPIMRQTPQPRRASKPLPKIDLGLVADCKVQSPNFGQRMAPRWQTAEPPMVESPRVATPQVAPPRQRSAPLSQSIEPPLQASPPRGAATPPQAPAQERGIGQE